jgi:N-methylhydantoinase A
LRIPVVEMVEIGAGGGSIARRDAARGIAVGPHSAGSSPGPACYGLGGAAPTVTDADLLLGKLDAESFAGGRLRLSRDAATDAMAALGAPHDAASDMALAISEIVDEAMASAARVHAVEQGVAIAGRTMIAFGGAAPLHAARVAEKLDIDTVMIPRDAAVGSAVGFLRAPTAYEAARSCRQALAAIDLDEVNAVLSELAESVDAVVANAAGAMPRQQSRTAFARYAGQGSEIPVPLPTRPLTAADAPLIRQGFERAYGNLYGPIVPNLPVEILSWRVRVVAETAQTQAPLAEAPEASRVQRANGESRVARANRQQPLRDSLASAARSTPVYDRDTLCPGDLIEGPAIIAERDTTTIVTGSFDVQVDRYLALILRRRGRAQPAGMPS